MFYFRKQWSYLVTSVPILGNKCSIFGAICSIFGNKGPFWAPWPETDPILRPIGGLGASQAGPGADRNRNAGRQRGPRGCAGPAAVCADAACGGFYTRPYMPRPSACVSHFQPFGQEWHLFLAGAFRRYLSWGAGTKPRPKLATRRGSSKVLGPAAFESLSVSQLQKAYHGL